MPAPRWVSRLKCYDGTEPDLYSQKVKERRAMLITEEIPEDESVINILRSIAAHSLMMPSAEHMDNKEALVSINWLQVEREGQKKSRDFAGVISECFGYYMNKKPTKILLEFFIRPSLGFNINLFFRLFSDIILEEEEKSGVVVNDELTPLWKETTERIEFIALCNAYLRACEHKVQNETISYLQNVLLDRANSRFKKSIEPLSGLLNHFTFRREFNRILDLTLSMTKTNSLFSYFDRKGVGLLKGEEVSQALTHMTIECQKSLTKKKQHEYQIKIKKKKKKVKPTYHSISADDPCEYIVIEDQIDQHIVTEDTGEKMIDNEGPHQNHVEETAQTNTKKEAFNQAVIKISSVISQSLQDCSFVPLEMPDGFVNETFVRNSLAEQLGIRLSKREVLSLCDRLREGNNTTASPSKIKSASTLHGRDKKKSFLPSIKNRSDDSDERKDIILGKYVKVFITTIKSMCAKRLGKIPSKPLLA